MATANSGPGSWYLQRLAMRDAVQLGAIEAVDVADIAMTCGTNRAIDTQKAAIFMVASVSSGNECVQNWEKY
jgi:hypothetical protein